MFVTRLTRHSDDDDDDDDYGDEMILTIELIS